MLTISIRSVFEVWPLLTWMLPLFLLPAVCSTSLSGDSAARMIQLLVQSPLNCYELLRKSEVDLGLYLYKWLGHSYNKNGISEREHKAQLRRVTVLSPMRAVSVHPSKTSVSLAVCSVHYSLPCSCTKGN